MSSERVSCPDCGFVGDVEAHGADDILGGQPLPKDVFELRGQDAQGHLRLKCPRCHAENTFLISAGFLMRVSTLLLAALGLAALCFLVRRLLFG